jgi:hypothetical protein
MIFQHTWEKVVSGEKTQTRRLVKPVHYQYRDFEVGRDVILGVRRADGSGWVANSDPFVWMVGNTYAVQPGRNKKSIARIRITGIRREDVRKISEEDVRAEGFVNRLQFLHTWIGMHDKALRKWAKHPWYFNDATMLIDDINNDSLCNALEHLRNVLNKQPDKFYDAWVLTFELVMPKP